MTTYLTPEVNGQAYYAYALCEGSGVDFFAAEFWGGEREAKTLCAACPVRGECLWAAIHNNEDYGVWGGLSERERYRMRKRANVFGMTPKELAARFPVRVRPRAA